MNEIRLSDKFTLIGYPELWFNETRDLWEKKDNIIILGTWEQFDKSEDAEERAKKWIHEETGKYKHYGFSCWWKMNALDSLHSAVKQITGDIFIIREDKQ